jgi:hypothetical protein
MLQGLRFYGMIKIPAIHDKDTSLAKFRAISGQVFPASLLGVSTDYCQRALVDESGMTVSQMGNEK